MNIQHIIEQTVAYVKSSLAIENFSVWELILFGVFALAFLIQIYWWIRYFCGIFRYNRRFRKNQVKLNYDYPSVSVVICAKNEEENLKKNIPLIMDQVYPDYEVIIVNDASKDDSEMVIAQLKTQYENLHSTYVPENAKFIDSKKFAVILGIKAAKNDIIVFTDADCAPASKDWLNNIVRHFDDKTEIVIGYGAYSRFKGLLNRFQIFDTLFIAIQYINYSLAGKTYMGVGRNMAYRKSMFMRTKGFSAHLNLQSGDDDLFINGVANKHNTKVEIQPDSKTISEPKYTWSSWCRQKERHMSTSPHYKASTKWLLGCELASRTIFYLSFIGAMFIGNYVTMAILALCFLIRYITQYVVINKTASQLEESHFWVGVMFMDIMIPLINLTINLKSALSSGSVYKWK